jgi:hypothetical protein
MRLHREQSCVLGEVSSHSQLSIWMEAYANMATGQMAALGHSLPMRSAPVSHRVGNGLKADVAGNWQAMKILRALTRTNCLLPYGRVPSSKVMR